MAIVSPTGGPRKRHETTALIPARVGSKSDETSLRIADTLRAAIAESIAVKQELLESHAGSLATAAGWMVESIASGGKLFLCGNGGSAADAQHIAAEFIGRFERERRSLPAIALTTDSSILTALANDYGVKLMFSRQLEALARRGDLLIALSTSGNSTNVLEAVKVARARGIRSIGLTGAAGGALADSCDLVIGVPSRRTARIQEAHITVCHALCEVVEAALTERPSS